MHFGRSLKKTEGGYIQFAGKILRGVCEATSGESKKLEDM